MKRIAICGNIASGKSTVQKILEEKGYKVMDTDEVSKKLLTVNNKELYDGFKIMMCLKMENFLVLKSRN